MYIFVAQYFGCFKVGKEIKRVAKYYMWLVACAQTKRRPIRLFEAFPKIPIIKLI